MPSNKTVQLSPEQEESLASIASQGIVNPIHGLRAMGLAPGHGEWEDLKPPSAFDSFLSGHGFQTETVRRNQQLREQQEIALPMIQALMAAGINRPTVGEVAATMPGFPLNPQLTPEYFSKKKVGVQVQGPGAPVIRQLPQEEFQGPGTPVQGLTIPGIGFTPEEMEQQIPSGLGSMSRNQILQTLSSERAQPFYFEGDQPSIPQQTETIEGPRPSIQVPGLEDELNVNKKLTPAMSHYYNELLMARRAQHARGPTPSDIVKMGIDTDVQAWLTKNNATEIPPDEHSEIIKKWQGLTNKERVTEIHKTLADSRAGLADAQANKAQAETGMIPARTDELKSQTMLNKSRARYYDALPGLTREIKAMSTKEHPQHFVWEAIKHVQDAVANDREPDPVYDDVFKSYLRRGASEYGMNFGEEYSRYGDLFKASKGKPTPEVKETKESLLNTLKELFSGKPVESQPESTAPQPKPTIPAKPTQPGKPAKPDLPVMKTPAEARKLKPGTRYKTPDGRELVRP